jgi:hypothetical protein
MRHPFMDAIARALAERRIATLRYQFPYMDAGSRRPDRAPVLHATVRAAVDRAAAEQLPVIAGGKSMGGRMSSSAAAAGVVDGVRGFAFLGFPLHPAGKPSTRRADHLADLIAPMLFVQGTRDRLAELDLLAPLVGRLGAHARLHLVEDADHGFAVRKRAGRTPADVIGEIANAVAAWAGAL